MLLNKNKTAVIALSTDILSFGAAKIGAADTLTFTVYNNGVDSTLQITGITTSNTVFTATPGSFSVIPGDSATVTVIFTPSAMVTYTDSLTIASNDPQNLTTKVYLSGSSPPPAIATVASTIDFGSVKIGLSGTDSLRIVNTSTTNDLSITGITSSGAVFTVAPMTGTVAPGDTLAVGVTFAPTDMLTYSDSLTIASNDPQQSQVAVYVSGVGNPILAVSPAQNALNVPLGTTISVTFGVDINPATINTNTFVVHGGYTGKLVGNYSYEGSTKTATFTPAQPFIVGERVSVTVTTGAVSAAGDTLVDPFNWNFTAEVVGGSGTFAAKTDYATGLGPFSLSSADLDGDGITDLVVTNALSNTVSVLLGRGDGTFAVKTDFAIGDDARFIFTADLDGDGDADLAVANSGSNTVSVLLNNGDGTFAPKTDYGTGDFPRSIVAADLDGDGDNDLAVANGGAGSSVVSVLLGNGDGTFAAKIDYATGSRPWSVFAADLNGDDDIDLATTNIGVHTVSVLLGNGDGTFKANTDYATGNVPFSVFAVDLDGDGDADLAVANSGAGSNSVSVLLGNGDGTFAAKTDYAAGTNPYLAILADLDGDGDLDLATANNGTNTVSVLLGNGEGTFAAKTDYVTELAPYSVVAADLDGDGDLDLATANFSFDLISVLLNKNSFSIFFIVDALTELSDTISLQYSISNPQNYPTSLLVDYSIDDGVTWQSPVIIGDTANLGPENYQGSLQWDSYADLPGLDSRIIRLRITPYDQVGQGRAFTTSAIHLDNNRLPVVTLSGLSGEQRGDVVIDYLLTDTEDDSLGLLCEYFDDAQSVWIKAAVAGDTSGLTIYTDQIIWQSAVDLPEGAGIFLFRITPYDNDPGVSDTLTVLIDQLGVPFTSAISQFTTEQSGDIAVSYTLLDDEGDTLGIQAEHSVDSGVNWTPATVSGQLSDIIPSQYSASLTWHSASDLPGVDRATVRFRITPHDAHIGVALETNDFHLDNNEPPSAVLVNTPDTVSVNMDIAYSLSDSESDTLSLLVDYSLDQGQSWVPASLLSVLTLGEITIIAPVDYTGTAIWQTLADVGFQRLSGVQLRITPSDVDPGSPATATDVTIRNYPADYTGDLIINTEDLAVFAAAWNAEPQEVIYEIGPATGEVPELNPQPDGVLDFEDLTVFAQMWNWSFANNGFAKSIPALAKATPGNPSVRLVQRIPADLWRWDGSIMVDVFVSDIEDLMMVDGVVSSAQGDIGLLEVENGGYLGQFFEATPLFTQISSDSSHTLFALVGLSVVEPTSVQPLPVATLHFRPMARKSQTLVLDYVLRGITGDPIEAGQIEIELQDLMPGKFALHQNYPNPFNPTTTIRFELAKPVDAHLVVYDILGREVITLRQEHLDAGYHQVLWKGRDLAGRDIASGIYIARLGTPEYTKSIKMVLLK